MRIHFVEFVDTTDSVIRQHECSGLDDKLGALLVLNDSGRQTRRRTGLAGCVNSPRAEIRNLEHIFW